MTELWPERERARFRSRAGQLLKGHPRAADIINTAMVALAEHGDPHTGKPIDRLDVWLGRTTRTTLTAVLDVAEQELLDMQQARRESLSGIGWNSGERVSSVIELRGPAFKRWWNLSESA